MRKLKKAVHGIDLGPMTPCLAKRLRTSDKRIDLAPEILVKDVERVKAKFLDSAPQDLNGNLLLIGRRHLRSNNSWMHNTRRLLRDDETQPRCTILMNPLDAAHRNLSYGSKCQS